MKVVVTGGAGFIGANLCRKLFPITRPVPLGPGLHRTIEWMVSEAGSLEIPTGVPA